MKRKSDESVKSPDSVLSFIRRLFRAQQGLSGSVVAFLLIFVGAGYAVSAAPPGEVKEAQTASYRYNVAGKPDPFRPFVEKELVVKKKAEKATSSSIFPLQKAGLEQFNLVGIVGDAERRLAIVEAIDNKGKFYPLALGTIIGLNNGKVVEIKNDMIVIEEVTKGSARQKVNRITIKLRRNEEEGTP